MSKAFILISFFLLSISSSLIHADPSSEVVELTLDDFKPKVNAVLKERLAGEKRILKGENPPASASVELNEGIFDKTVIQSKDFWMVLFYTPWCGYCKELLPHWNNAATKLKGKMNFGQVNCDNEKGLMGRYKVPGFPIILLFGEDKQTPINYDRERNAAGLEAFSLDQLKSRSAPKLTAHVNAVLKERLTLEERMLGVNPPSSASVELNEGIFDKTVIQSKDFWMVLFYTPWCGYCKELLPHWNNAATKLKGKMNFGQVNCDNEKGLMGRYKVPGFPIILLFGEDKQTPINYDRERNAAGLEAFSLDQLKSRSAPKLTAHVNVVLKERLTLEERMLGVNPPASASVELNEGIFDKTVIQSKDFWMVLFYTPWCGYCKELLPHWNNAATKLKGKMNFGQVNCDNEKGLMGRYKVPGFPVILLFGEDKQTPINYDRERNAAGLEAFSLDKLKSRSAPKLTGPVNAVLKERLALEKRTLKGENPPASASIELNEGIFDKTVIQSKECWMVLFYTPWCGYCKELLPHWNNAAMKLKGKMNFGQVNCDNEKGLMGRYKVPGFPIILLFGEDKQTPINYDRERNAAGLEAFSLDHLKSHSAPALTGPVNAVLKERLALEKRTLKGENPPASASIELNEGIFDKTVIQSKECWMVLFYTPWCGYCKELLPHWNNAAMKLKGKMNFGQVNCDNEKGLMGRYKVPGFPIILLFGEDKQTPINYDRERNAAGLEAFSLDHLKSHSAPALTGPVNAVLKERLALEKRTLKGENPPASASIELNEGIFDKTVIQSKECWMVLFYTPWCGYCKELLPHWNNAAMKLKGKMNFGQVNCDNEKGLMGRYKVPGFPIILLFGEDKQTPVNYDRERNAAGLEAFSLDHLKSHSAPALTGPVNAVLKERLALEKRTLKGENPPASASIELNEGIFDKTVIQSKECWMVLFYTPWCGYCKELLPHWNNAAMKLKGKMNFGQVNCDNEKGLMGRYKVPGFPIILLFGEDKQTPVNYDRERNAAGLEAFSLDHLKSHSAPALTGPVHAVLKERLAEEKRILNGENPPASASVELNEGIFETTIIQSKDFWMVLFYTPWCGYCKELFPHWNNAATNLKGKMNFGQVNCDNEKALMGRYKVSGFPRILLFGEDKQTPIKYDRERNAAGLEAFSLDQLKGRSNPVEVTELISPDVMKLKCGSPVVVCFVAFLPSDGRKKHIDTLLAVAEKLKGSPYSYVWAGAGKQPEFEKHVGVGGSSYPALIALNTQKGVYAPLKTPFEQNPIIDFVKAAGLEGKDTLPLQGAPTVVKTEPWDGKEGQTIKRGRFIPQ